MHIVTDRIPAADITPDQLLDAITGTDIGTADQGCNLSHVDIGVIVIMTPTETIPGHIIDIVDATIEALHVTTTVLIAFTTTPYTEYHPHAEVPQLIPETAADPDHVLHISQVIKVSPNLHPVLAGQQ